MATNNTDHAADCDPDINCECEDTEPLSACCGKEIDERGFCTRCRDHA